MTEHELNRGKEIENEISSLEYALMEASRSSLLRVDDGRCGTRKSDSFLAELNVNIRKIAVDAINARLTELRKEFVQL